jgi:hypothetical protein
MKKIIEDMRNKKKRKRYRKYIVKNFKRKDAFIKKLEKTFQISYDLDLRYIDDENNSNERSESSRKSSKNIEPV